MLLLRQSILIIAGSNYQFKDSLHAQLETYYRVLLAAAQPEDALVVEAMKTVF